MVQRLYNLKVSTVKELNSYDDKTYLITVDSTKFVFKITNEKDSAIRGLIGI